MCDNYEYFYFYLKFFMVKVCFKKNVVFGFVQLVVEDVLLFIVIFFGFFLFNSSYLLGFIMFIYGDEMNCGFYLCDGGYYFVISDCMDLKVLGEIFMKGLWGLFVQFNYNKRYKYSGNFNVSYLVMKIGEKNMLDYMVIKDFRIVWSYRQDVKVNFNSFFLVNVNFVISSYDQCNLSSLYNLQQYLNNIKMFSVSYLCNFFEIGLNLFSIFNIFQNMCDFFISVMLLDLNILLNCIYLFKCKKVVGDECWYEKILF